MQSKHYQAALLAVAVLMAGQYWLWCGTAAAESAAPSQVTVPLVLGDNGRPYVDVSLRGSSGEERTVRMLLDTGGGAFILGEDVAGALGLEWGEARGEGGNRFAPVETTPEARLGGKALSLTPERVIVAVDASGMPKDDNADGLFPGHVLAQYHVILDYPAGELTLAEPGTVEPRGKALSMGVSRPMGFPRTTLTVGGKEYGFLLDSGPPATIVSQAVVGEWREANPGWPHAEGAAGMAKALEAVGGQVLETLTVEKAAWGPFELAPFEAGAQREGVFEEYMSRMMTEPVVGALGSNVLRRFRVELDYDDETLYLSWP
jgi:hypothetical protein